jgi:hypothetical protein
MSAAAVVAIVLLLTVTGRVPSRLARYMRR